MIQAFYIVEIKLYIMPNKKLTRILDNLYNQLKKNNETLMQSH